MAFFHLARTSLCAMALAQACSVVGDGDMCRLSPEPLRIPADFPAQPSPLHRGTDLGRALGRKLFFDPRLSHDGRVSCASCHAPEHAFSVAEARVSRGVSGRRSERHPPALLNLAHGEAVARGRARFTRRASDAGKVKAPTLRQVTRSAPYMHDGRFATLRQVIDHYRSGMLWSDTLDSGFRRDRERPGIRLSDSEAEALEAFLCTLE